MRGRGCLFGAQVPLDFCETTEKKHVIHLRLFSPGILEASSQERHQQQVSEQINIIYVIYVYV